MEICDLGFEEKIALMEQLWEDLSREHENEIIPDWHHEILKQREDSQNFEYIDSVRIRLKSE